MIKSCQRLKNSLSFSIYEGIMGLRNKKNFRILLNLTKVVQFLYWPEVVLGYYTQAQQSILLAKTPWKRPYQLGLFYWPLEAARTRKPAVLSFLYYLHYYYYARLSSKESGCAMIHHQVLPLLMLSSYPSKKLELVGHAMVLSGLYISSLWSNEFHYNQEERRDLIVDAIELSSPSTLIQTLSLVH